MLHAFTHPKYILMLLVTFIMSAADAQDTIWVQGFNYSSKTRDSLITFPAGNHQQYEKILMYYSMRCKNALVSTGSDRNKGCGEWDYSCNTNIIDSTGIDSLKALHPNFIIQGISENYFYYTTKPTYTYYDFKQKKVTVNGQSGVSYAQAGMHAGNATIMIADNKAKKMYVMYKKSELSSFGTGAITGMQWNTTSPGSIPYFKIKLAATNENNLNTDLIQNLTFDEVLNNTVAMQASGKTDLIFHKVFPFNGSSNIIMEVSYTEPSDNNPAPVITSTVLSENVSLSNIEPDHYIELSSQGVAQIPAAPLSTVTQQITVAFWSKGNDKVLPNNNSAFYAEDKNAGRQLNVHLPWSNGRIYWDCGGDAAGYDRIDKLAVPSEYEGAWNHWAFTKNTATGSMKIYLNGALWHSGSGKIKPINIDKLVLGGDINNTIPYSGSMDDFTVWNKELTAAEIKSIMFASPLSDPQLSGALLAYYDMNEAGGTLISDKSIHQATGVFSENPQRRFFRGDQVFKSFSFSNIRPDISFIKGNFNITVTDITVRDSTINAPYKITPYLIENNTPKAQSPFYAWASGYMPVYDEDGALIDEVEVPEEDAVFIENLTYYQKSPAKYELLSFVTPYGIGLDLGSSGKTWIFDVTDYGPVLKQNKRLLMDKGGEWQEEIDIKFAFIKGKPSRPVLSIQQVWPATAYGYTSILNNNHLGPRDLYCEPEVKSMKIRTVATGHGQEGEFISRMHSINVNGGSTEFIWPLWKECADNPIYPQGGTWVYDRAGWCPGAPSDLREFEIMPYVQPGQPFSLDYGLNTASGDSRYIVSTQLVKYGEANFLLDAAIDEIITPSKNVVFQRINPVCANPVIVLKNNGKTTLTAATIKYGVEGYPLATYTWTGRLEFLQTQKVTLPNLPAGDLFFGSNFVAYLESANNIRDEYAANDRKQSEYATTPFLEGGLIVAMKTNGMPNETKWTLKDDAGNIISTSKPNLTGFTLYQDTIKGLSGCYQLQFTDSDDDGISWWANGDGDGFIRAKGITSPWQFFQPDFGKELTFNFVTGLFIQTDDVSQHQKIRIFPNPSSDFVQIEMKDMRGETVIEVYQQNGATVHEEKIFLSEEGTGSFSLNVSQWNAGMYILRVKNAQDLYTTKLLKW